MKRPYQLLQIGMMAGALTMVPVYAQSGSADQGGSSATQPSGSGAGSGAGSGTAAQPGGAGSGAGSGMGSGSAAGSGQTVAGTDMNSPSGNNGNHDNGFNFGWLGLLGLAGLLGTRHHNNRTDNRYESRNIDNTGPGGIR